MALPTLEDNVDIGAQSSAGVLSGAATGAQMGNKIAGPWGAAFGAIGGAMVGFGTANVAAYEAKNKERATNRGILDQHFETKQEDYVASKVSKNPFNPVNTFSQNSQDRINGVMDPNVPPYASTAVTNRNDQLRSLGLGTTGDLINHR